MNADQRTNLRQQLWEYDDQHTEYALLHIETALRKGVIAGTVKEGPCHSCGSPGPTVTPEFYQIVKEMIGGRLNCKDWNGDITLDTTEGSITRIADWEDWTPQLEEDSEEEIYVGNLQIN